MITMNYDVYQRVQTHNSKQRRDHGNELFHKLREVRIAKGISQEALSRMIGCSINDINRYERRNHLPNADTFVAWLEVLGFTIVAPRGEENE
jgi:transcriptional regulator with XRE-family HTH domain